MGPRATLLLNRLAGWPRRLLAAALLLLGVVSGFAATSPATAQVVVAEHDLAAGEAVSSADLAVVQRPVSDRPGRALTTVAAAVGQRAIGAITRGEVLTAVRLAPAAFTGALAVGHTAVTVPVDAGAAQLLRSSTIVDVISLSTSNNMAEGANAQTLVTTSARVLAVWPGTDPDRRRDVTLEVLAADAAPLAVAAAQRVLAVVIRSP